MDHSGGVSGAEADGAPCEESARKSDGCNPCWCHEGEWRCGQAACSVDLGDAMYEGPRCYPLCPEAVDPHEIREAIECLVVANELGRLEPIAPCEGEADGCFRVRTDRLDLSASTEDDVAAQCIVDGNGIEIELVGLEGFEGHIEASCTIWFATTRDTCSAD